MKKYERLTKYIDEFVCENSFGEWVFDRRDKGTEENPLQFPYLKHEEFVFDFIHDFCDGNYWINNYLDEGNKIYKSINSGISISDLSEEKLLVFLTWIIRQERFCEGLLVKCCKEGIVYEILKGLKAYDDES